MVFLVALYFIKNGALLTGKLTFDSNSNGLIYDEQAAVEDLVSKDSDDDGVLDWEESVMGLDPTTPETTPGIPDITVAAKLRAEEKTLVRNENGELVEQSLTETDKFSRELFSTVAALNQNGTMDQAAVDKISDSLISQLKTAPQKRVFTEADLKITKNNSKESIQKYYNALNTIHDKYPIKGNAILILQKALLDDGEINTGTLSELDLIITPTKNTINEALKVEVPDSLAFVHLNFLNSLERMNENLADMKTIESDPVVAMSALTQYEENADALISAFTTLVQTIENKLKS